MTSARARGTAPCAWSTVPSMASSSPVWRGDGIKAPPGALTPRRGRCRTNLVTGRWKPVKGHSASGTRPVTDSAPVKTYRWLGFLAAADRPPVLDLLHHAVTPKAPRTGSGWRGDSYGGPGGGHPHFHPIRTAGNLKRPQEGDHAGFRPSRPSVWSRTGAFEATGTGGPKAGPRAAGS